MPCSRLRAAVRPTGCRIPGTGRNPASRNAGMRKSGMPESVIPVCRKAAVRNAGFRHAYYYREYFREYPIEYAGVARREMEGMKKRTGGEPPRTPAPGPCLVHSVHTVHSSGRHRGCTGNNGGRPATGWRAGVGARTLRQTTAQPPRGHAAACPYARWHGCMEATAAGVRQPDGGRAWEPAPNGRPQANHPSGGHGSLALHPDSGRIPRMRGQQRSDL